MRVSLIVPTYNRANFLKHSIPSFINQSLDKDLYEIIVVDNNSNDDTKEVVNTLLKNTKVQWRYVFEPDQGLHNARNTGILEGKGDIIVFGDDDIVAPENWLELILKEFDSNEKAGVVGGKVLPIWSEEPPKWIFDYGSDKLHFVFAFLNYGEQRIVLEKQNLLGCNFALRKDIALKTGGSYPDTYPKSLKHLSGRGECAIVENVRNLNYEIIYLPDAYIHHHIDASRISLEYFIDRYERLAVEHIYNFFRNMRKAEAVIKVLQLYFKTISKLDKRAKRRINPEFYIKIQKEYAKTLLKQTIRVLYDKNLHNHIIREHYLKESVI